MRCVVVSDVMRVALNELFGEPTKIVDFADDAVAAARSLPDLKDADIVVTEVEVVPAAKPDTEAEAEQ